MDRYQAIQATSRPINGDELSPASLDPYKRLAAGILAQAAKEAKAGELAAAYWLLSEQAEFLAGAVGLSWPHVQRWACGIIDSKFSKKKLRATETF